MRSPGTHAAQDSGAGRRYASAWRALARHLGIQATYRDGTGEIRSAPRESIEALITAILGQRAADPGATLRALEAEAGERLLEPVYALWRPGRRSIPLNVGPARSNSLDCEVVSEDGSVRGWTVERGSSGGPDSGGRTRLRLPDLQPGYYDLRVTYGRRRADSLLVVAPVRAYQRPGSVREWGAFLPLYALHSARSWGIGDFTDLGAVRHWAQGQGAATVGTLPLLASFLDEGTFEPSPYSPASRLMWNEVFLDLEALPEFATSQEAQRLARSADFQAEIGALRRARLVDYRGVATAKRSIVETLEKTLTPARRTELEAFLGQYTEVGRYARFRATTERHGPRQHWPRTNPDFDPASERYHAYAQWVAESQIASAAGASHDGLYLDLPLGVNGAGYDVWRWPRSFLEGLSAGAPPDPLAAGGQDWGFPPPHPVGNRESRYEYVRAYLRHHLRHAGRLRIDHVMGLHRLFAIPSGAPASEGAYLRYPAEELYAILSLESHRHRAEIVGENLGTVPRYVNTAMRRHALSRMYVLPFEVETWAERPIRPPAADAAASLNTHDLPPFAAWWSGDDITSRVGLGHLRPEDVPAERDSRRGLREAIVRHLTSPGLLSGDAGGNVDSVLEALLRFLGSGDARLVLLNLEDLWAETDPQNVPGTSAEVPNWRRKAALSLEEMQASPAVERLLHALDDARRGRP